MSSFYCRPAEKTDLKALNHLLKISKGYWGYDADFMADFTKNLSLTPEILADSLTILLYVTSDEKNRGSADHAPGRHPSAEISTDKKLAGFYSFAKREENHRELTHFYMHPDFIGQGWGQKMWHLAVETAHKKGWDKFLLWSDPHANEFYEKMGCQLIRFERSSLGKDRYQAVYIARPL